jgi:hypothetical protein
LLRNVFLREACSRCERTITDCVEKDLIDLFDVIRARLKFEQLRCHGFSVLVDGVDISW